MEEEIVNLEREISANLSVTSVRNMFYAARKADLPTVVWSLPRDNKVHFVAGFSTNTTSKQYELEISDPGFLLGKFESQFPEQNSFIPADIYFNTKTGLRINTPTSEADRSKFKLWKSLVNQPDLLEYDPGNLPEQFGSGTDRETYLKIAKKGMNRINSGMLKKIVPARLEVIDQPPGFDPVNTFQKLMESYSDAFISLISLPGQGIWMGASPEMLIRVNENDQFFTTALAGTQLYNPAVPLVKAPWTQKEIEEQAYVSRYIIDCFKKIRLREFEEVGPRTTRAGSLLHLKTDFQVDLKATNFPQLGTVMLKLLHPTSAISGMPKDQSHDFLIEHEQFDREFFSGFLGPVNVENTIDIFVNIRCMQILKSKIRLYAGAGITAYSDPESEWEETGHKIAVMKSRLQVY